MRPKRSAVGRRWSPGYETPLHAVPSASVSWTKVIRPLCGSQVPMAEFGPLIFPVNLAPLDSDPVGDALNSRRHGMRVLVHCVPPGETE